MYSISVLLVGGFHRAKKFKQADMKQVTQLLEMFQKFLKSNKYFCT